MSLILYVIYIYIYIYIYMYISWEPPGYMHAPVSLFWNNFLFFFTVILIFWQYSSGSTPLTGMEAGLLTTTTSSSMCITVIGSEVTGTSCLQHTNRNQLNVALFLLLLSSTLSLSLILSRTHRDTSFVFIRVSSKDSGSGCRFLFFKGRM